MILHTMSQQFIERKISFKFHYRLYFFGKWTQKHNRLNNVLFFGVKQFKSLVGQSIGWIDSNFAQKSKLVLKLPIEMPRVIKSAILASLGTYLKRILMGNLVWISHLISLIYLAVINKNIFDLNCIWEQPRQNGFIEMTENALYQ